MIAIIFELQPAAGCADAYFDIAANLRPILEQIDGFVSVKRFESLTQPDKYLSMSFFANEEAVMNWRNTPEHRAAQGMVRNSIFSGYRLRVATVIRDYSLVDRDQAPADSIAAHCSFDAP